MLANSKQSLRRALLLGALVATAVSGWALAPAFSAQPYVPVARDFEQSLPGLTPVARGKAEADAHAGEPPVSHRSAPIVAPARFDLAGIAGVRRHYELRGREAGGKWTRWTEAREGDPVWFGGADQLQVRTRGWAPGRDLDLHYVNVSGDATPADAALTEARSGFNSAIRTAAALLAPGGAGAGLSKPKMVKRGEWGANRSDGGCPPRTGPSYGSVRAAVVHHTVSATNYSAREAPGMVLGICRYHRYGNGWDDIGYNALVDRFGNLYVGRAGGIGRAVVGAHTQGYNEKTTGLAALGTHTTEPLARRALRRSARYLAWKLPKHGVSAVRGRTRLRSAGGDANRYASGTRVRTKRITGHRRLNYTTCPGDKLNRQLRRLRLKTQRKIDAAADGTDSGGGTGGTGSR